MMKVLMLGWEYPPNITGGLGTACEGLTKALTKHGLNIQFVVPKIFGDEKATHMDLVEPAWDQITLSSKLVAIENTVSQKTETSTFSEIAIPSFLSPYLNVTQYQKKWESVSAEELETYLSHLREFLRSMGVLADGSVDVRHYGHNLFDEVERYAQRVLAWANVCPKFDLIHAHDWMTFSAGILLKEMTGCPLVVHVHSLEHDRSGECGNPRIMAIESLGMQKADCVIAVSQFTKSRIQEKYHINGNKISVIHNGMPPNGRAPKSQEFGKNQASEQKQYVLFLGRITFQKGPDYFVEAAKRVIPELPNVVFVMGGAGDMLPNIRRQVHELGLDKNFEFPGFLKGEEVEKAYAMADLYVMPSVSEPFGLAPLEAISFNTPVLISRQSGVSEVLSHALKANFWDVDELADLIVGALKYPELRRDMVKMAQEEVRHITWDSAAKKTIEKYFQVMNP